MKTKEVYSIIDGKSFAFTQLLQKNGLAYRLDKVRNAEIWTVQIGKFEGITDPWIQGEISNYSNDSIEKQFGSILKQAINDKLVNYTKKGTVT